VSRETPDHYYRLSAEIRGKSKLYVIATEGYCTEYNYFMSLRKQYSALFNEWNLQVEILRRPDLQEGNSSPNSTEQMLTDFLEDNKNSYDLKSYDELWLIIDTDTWKPEQIEKLSEKCHKETHYHLGLSNPCFELWLILHLADSTQDVRTYCVTDKQKINAPRIKKCIETLENNNHSDFSLKNCLEMVKISKRSQACKQLQNLINNHHHLSSYQKLIDYIPKAISRAKALGECDPSDDNYPQNLCTSVYKLLETLLQHNGGKRENKRLNEASKFW
jgi:hypothetical protein